MDSKLSGTANTDLVWSWGNFGNTFANGKGLGSVGQMAGSLGLLGSGIGQLMLSGVAGELASAQASAYRLQGQLSSASYRDQGNVAVRNMGIVQQEGLDAATLRYEQLGREIAAQRVTTAGSGIDASSKVVSKAESTSRKNAGWDVEHISKQAKIAADNYNQQAAAAYKNSAFAQIQSEYQARVAEIQGDLADKTAFANGIGGIVGGTLRLLSGAFSGGLGSAGAGNGFP